MSKALEAALREAGRLIVLAIVPALVVALSDLNPVWGGIALVVLRSAEKYAYKIGGKSLPF